MSLDSEADDLIKQATNKKCRYCAQTVAEPCRTHIDTSTCPLLGHGTKEEPPVSPTAKSVEAGVPANPAEMTVDHDMVRRPKHYTRFEIEPIHFIMVNDLPFWLGNIVKYGLRWDAKDGIQDLYKAKRYLEMKIKQLEGNPKWSE